ncbi:MAG: hypothetical protein JRH15_04795 [Deltaproteobacteria bacterium]|nr:hypothetical protein [Deltaproteobacteria bacterium]
MTIVCGFRRIAACKGLSWSRIPIRALLTDVPDIDCAKLAIADNLSQRSLNIVETSRALAILRRLIPDPKLFSETVAALGLPHAPAIVNKMERVGRLPQLIQSALISGEVALSSAMMLEQLAPEPAQALSKIIIKLKLTLSKQRELIVTLLEIAKAETVCIQSIIQGTPIQTILTDPDRDANQKTRLLRDLLHRRRFPHLSQATTDFDRLIAELGLGKNAKLTAPAAFESRKYTLTLQFTTKTELSIHHQTLQKLLDHPGFMTHLKKRAN